MNLAATKLVSQNARYSRDSIHSSQKHVPAGTDVDGWNEATEFQSPECHWDGTKQTLNACSKRILPRQLVQIRH